jgi:hypothetical protein
MQKDVNIEEYATTNLESREYMESSGLVHAWDIRAMASQEFCVCGYSK